MGALEQFYSKCHVSSTEEMTFFATVETSEKFQNAKWRTLEVEPSDLRK